MIIVIHGENLTASRQKLEELKKASSQSEIINLDAGKTSLNEIKQALQSNAMFDDSRTVIIENLFSARKSKNQEEIIEYLSKNDFKSEIILWEKTSLARSHLAKLKDTRILEFKLEPILFRFLESLRPNNQGEMLTLLLRSIKAEEPEMIFYMMIRQIRLLILVKDGVVNGTEELDRLVPWQRQKLTKQANYFTMDVLLKIYRKLFEIDKAQKTGTQIFDLRKSLELFLTNIYSSNEVRSEKFSLTLER